ncbi:thiamine biosynthetic bifunctional enzyme [Podospora conica]|nr:thiamine biosynthetic bifunctional enzyme [Schizothecium conicum]
MEQEACCTCATLLSAVPRFPPAPTAEGTEKPPLPISQTEKPPLPVEDTEKPPLPYDPNDEKQQPYDYRRLPCCSRIICSICITQNRRYRSYCPYCQVPSSSSSADPPPLHPHHDPPPYSSLPAAAANATDVKMAPSDPEKAAAAAAAGGGLSDVGGEVEDTLHFLDHANDSVTSLSLRYGVPAEVLRRTNNLAADHLLAARRTILIPGGGVSLSPRPVEGEAEEARKAKIRRFMVACKVSEYDEAVFYLEQTGYDFPAAVEAFFADDAWEREHPLANGDKRSPGRRKKADPGGGGWFAKTLHTLGQYT